MKRKNTRNTVKVNNNSITIKKDTALKLLSSVPISWVLYKFNEKLDLIADRLKKSEDAILFLTDRYNDKINKVPGVSNVEIPEVSKVWSFLADSSLNIAGDRKSVV